MSWLNQGARVRVACLAWVFLSGCSTASPYQTDTNVAKEALKASLNAWKSGDKAESLTSRTPSVHAVDEQWKSGKALVDFEIVSEGSADENVYFEVKLKHAKESDIETRYYIVGLDPIWVYRAEDYARLINMDNNPKKKAVRKGATGRGPS